MADRWPIVRRPSSNRSQPSITRRPTVSQSSSDRQSTVGRPSVNRHLTVSQPSINRRPNVRQPSAARQSTFIQPWVHRQSTVDKPSTRRQPTVSRRDGRLGECGLHPARPGGVKPQAGSAFATDEAPCVQRMFVFCLRSSRMGIRRHSAERCRGRDFPPTPLV